MLIQPDEKNDKCFEIHLVDDHGQPQGRKVEVRIIPMPMKVYSLLSRKIQPMVEAKKEEYAAKINEKREELLDKVRQYDGRLATLKDENEKYVIHQLVDQTHKELKALTANLNLLDHFELRQTVLTVVAHYDDDLFFHCVGEIIKQTNPQVTDEDLDSLSFGEVTHLASRLMNSSLMSDPNRLRFLFDSPNPTTGNGIAELAKQSN